MADLKGSRTHENLKAAFAMESTANRRYLFFARRADIEGFPELAGLFRDIAEGETGHAHGHLERLAELGDPATDEPIGTTSRNLRAAVLGETKEQAEIYPEYARIAREEGFEEIAAWFDTVARAEKFHAARFRKGLEALEADEVLEDGTD